MSSGRHMTNYIQRNLLQNASYWEPGAQDGFGGKTWSAPVVIKCRWEDKQELYIDNQGNETRSDATVYVKIDLELGGYLFKGITAALTPNAVVDAREIVDFRSTPDLHNRLVERKLLLKKVLF